MDNNLISRAEMCKALCIDEYDKDALLDKTTLETEIANKEYDHRTEVVWDIRGNKE